MASEFFKYFKTASGQLIQRSHLGYNLKSLVTMMTARYHVTTCHTCNDSASVEQINQGMFGFQEKSYTLFLCPPCMNCQVATGNYGA
ncbi:hypothetical protein M514_02356 [Trichuris suis]|uniref:Uncharacterized protein n=1 Tax=Trichuris suis TaxID=68888 RepID=A0A085NBM8_9BILA|nr:hypothetical protein M513_02356 [Trichuris suis]KFD66874.1 hypothetical protein M514_02356 [Trichuris suis]